MSGTDGQYRTLPRCGGERRDLRLSNRHSTAHPRVGSYAISKRCPLERPGECGANVEVPPREHESVYSAGRVNQSLIAGPYALPTRTLLRWHCDLPKKLLYDATALRCIGLRAHYTMSGTDVGYAATRSRDSTRSNSAPLPLVASPHAAKSNTSNRIPGTNCTEAVVDCL
eukprot:2776408-Rhodomonas_salina.2